MQILLEMRDDNSTNKAKYDALNLAMDGFIVQTEKRPYCGQYAWISRVSRNDLELIEEEEKCGG